jgi:predicted 3-demethylubiquinone-9 3-methyltransferase (glyoxalase superfamily)
LIFNFCIATKRPTEKTGFARLRLIFYDFNHQEYSMQKITPFLWFNNEAEEAVKFYSRILKGTKVKKRTRYGKNMPLPEGTVMTIEFKMLNQQFTALNGGPVYKFNEAVSFVVHCDTQKQVDAYWKKLTADGGREIQCGWLKDKFGLTWQIVPKDLIKFLTGKDKKKAGAAAQAMMQMKKLDINIIKKAYHSAE